MSRMTIDKARRSTDMFSLRRFGGAGTTKESRHRAWLAFRTEGVGGSDMSTILGLNTYTTPYELWLEKTGRQKPEDISGRWAIIKGNALEVELRRRFRQLHPEYQVIDGTDISLVSISHPVMHASLDGFIYDEASDSWGILEIKTANANRGRTDWHDDMGELIAPDYYMAQVTHYMAVTGFRWGYVYADIGESEPVEIRFERDEDDVNAVITAAEDFWGFVARDEMPRLTGQDVAKAYPDPAEGIEDMTGDSDLQDVMDSYRQVIADEKALKARKEELQDCILVYVGDHEGVRCGNLQATYKTSSRKGYTRVVEPWEGRTFRFSEIKERRTDYGTVSDTGAERADAGHEPAAPDEAAAREELASHRGGHAAGDEREAPLPDVREHHQPRTPAGQLLGRIGVVMLHALHEPRSGTVERERARHGLHPAIR